MKKTIKLNEGDLKKIITKIIMEQELNDNEKSCKEEFEHLSQVFHDKLLTLIENINDDEDMSDDFKEEMFGRIYPLLDSIIGL